MLEPIPSNWVTMLKQKINLVDKQYTEMYKYSHKLSKIIRDLITDIGHMMEMADQYASILKNSEEDLEDAQAQLAPARWDADNYKKQHEELDKRYHTLFDSHSQEHLDLKKQVEDAKSESVRVQLACTALEQEKAELEKKNTDLAKGNAELEAKLLEAESRVVLAEGNTSLGLKSAETEAQKELDGYGELMIEFFAQVICRRDISSIEDYLTTWFIYGTKSSKGKRKSSRWTPSMKTNSWRNSLGVRSRHVWPKGVDSLLPLQRKKDVRTKEKISQKPVLLLLHPGIPEQRHMTPKNPGIPQASLLSPIPESMSETLDTPIEKSSEGIFTFSPQFFKAISTIRHIIRQSIEDPSFSPELTTVTSCSVGTGLTEKIDGEQKIVIDERYFEETREKREEVAAEKSGGEAEGEKKEVADKAPVPPNIETPHTEEMIDALKDDGDDDGHEEDVDVVIIGDSQNADDLTLAEMKAKQDKRMQLKTEEMDPKSFKLLATIPPKSRLVDRLSTRSITEELAKKSSTYPSALVLSKKKPKWIQTDAKKEEKEKLKAAKKAKSTPKSK